LYINQVKILKAIKTVDPKDESSYILGQYTKSSDGKKPGYTEDESVENKDSKTATFAEMALQIDNERWQGVPWILKSAKAIEEDIMRVIIHLKPSPNSGFTSLYDGVKPAALVLELFETKKVYFSINSRKPGFVGGPTRSKLILDWDSPEMEKVGKSLDPYSVVIGEAIRGREENCK
jgi:glucose-6-phosphate 1-dehydrogenase